MSLFEKIELDPIESVETVDEPKSSRQFKSGDTHTISYNPWMKVVLLFVPLTALPLLQIFIEEGFFFLEMLCFVALVYFLWFIADSLFTESFTLSPEKIVKNRVFGRSEIPSTALILHVKDQDISFFHGSDKNLREAMKIRRFFISATDYADTVKYAGDVYRVVPNQDAKDGSPHGKSCPSQLVVAEYLKAASNYRVVAAAFVILPLLAVFTVGLSDSFFGMAPSLPAYPIRLASIVLAIGGFYLLRGWSRYASQASRFSLSLMTRLDRADGYAFNSALLSASVASLGLLLFWLFGNTLDLYLFLLVGGLYFYDCYPRFSTWERLAASDATPDAGEPVRALLPRRSLQISLVLMGTLAVASYGESNHYLYANRKDCQDDWGDGTDCRELSGGGSGGGHTGGGRYYGPRYGSGSGRAPHSVGVGTISRGGFGSLGGFHGSFGG